VACGFALATVLPAAAQVAPSAAEAAAYSGLHAAAWKGDAAKIEKLAAGGNVNARDAHGRTPLHVATFA
jgi:ankyrin repeat protein